jgi:hypothetical protein
MKPEILQTSENYPMNFWSVLIPSIIASGKICNFHYINDSMCIYQDYAITENKKNIMHCMHVKTMAKKKGRIETCLT